MDKSELKRTALEALNASGAANDKGNFQEAKDKAQKAWNCYYELQKLRNEDEDFSDLIYYARNMYEKAQAALDEQAQANTPEEKVYDPFDLYLEVRRFASNGFAGNVADGVTAAIWYTDPKNSTFLEIVHSKYIADATQLLTAAINNANAPLYLRVVAANAAAKMYMLPMYENVNVEKARSLSHWAVNAGAEAEDLDLETLVDVYRTAIKAATMMGDVEEACKYASDAVSRGSDMGVWMEICSYGCRHDQDWAEDIEERMYADGCWPGLFFHGQTLTDEWMDDYENDEKYQAVKDYALYTLCKYGDEHWGEEGGYACNALTIYMVFLQNMDGFVDQEIMSDIKKSAVLYSPYALYYLGEIYYTSAMVYQEKDSADTRVETLLKEAFNCYGKAAGLGHRGGIRQYLKMLKDGYGDPDQIAKYTAYAKQLDVDLS